ncbi:39S ribosomal protein L53/MRP-L53 domain-containing protein [Neurospora intermedia]|uniref:Large ribosomal subunit protein mL53 n=1 Tax=Neurospora intermedia TaxID=5142 RepID=A0ABR3DQI9_NEUIN
MLTRFITDVSTRFNPFSAKAKAARLFLSFLPPNARSNGMNITTQLLPRNSTETPLLYVKFSMFSQCRFLSLATLSHTSDRRCSWLLQS